jgi:putative Mg2+ transporter-C (MgtC) family protein
MADTVVFHELSNSEAALRMAAAAGLGALVGLEREWRERAAGLRTHLLVSIGACALTIVGAYGFADFWNALELPAGSPAPMRDPTRVAAQIVTGIGFLGGGVILRSGFSVRGLTTAASIWAVSAVGMAAGAGMYALGAMLTFGLLFTLIAMRKLNEVVSTRYHQDTARVVIRVTSDQPIDGVMKVLDDLADDVDSFSAESAGLETDDQIVIMQVDLVPGISRVRLGRELTQVPGVTEVHVGAADR